EQSRILDGDYGLSGKILDQFDLLVAERTHFLAVHADRANQLVLLEHWHQNVGPHAYDLNERDYELVFAHVGLISPKVGNVDDLFGLEGAVEGDSGIFALVDHRATPQNIDMAFLALKSYGAKDGSLTQEQIAECGLTDARRIRQHGIEDRLQL